MTDAAWKPDPTGRHELRYWDGTSWTDHVSDAGVSVSDPLQAAPTSSAPSARSKTPWVVGGIVAVVALAAAAFVLLGGESGGRDLTVERTGLTNFLDDNDAPTDVLDDPVDIPDCPYEFSGRADREILDADPDATDVDPDADIVVVFLPPDEQAISCSVFVDDRDKGYLMHLYVTAIGEGEGSEELTARYEDLSKDTGIGVEFEDLGSAKGGEMFQACADQFVLPGDNPDDFVAEPYCDTVWVSDGLIVGLEQFGSQSIDAEAGKGIVLFILDDVLQALEGQA